MMLARLTRQDVLVEICPCSCDLEKSLLLMQRPVTSAAAATATPRKRPAPYRFQALGILVSSHQQKLGAVSTSAQALAQANSLLVTAGLTARCLKLHLRSHLSLA